MALRRLLIVDDELLIRETLAEYLGHEGFAVTTCATGEEALTTAGEQHFEVVLCDVQLPDLDGLELLDRLLKISPDSSVLLITAYATVENAIQAFQRGADRDADGLFVHAGRGTIFLDEIGEMPPATQAKLLRAIEQKEVLPVGANEPVYVEARILAASNKDLDAEVEAGRFREDLYYRLNVVSIRLPALRERREDIPDLVEYLLDRHARTLGKPIHGVTHEAMQRLRAGRWKGNVRELDNVLERAVILGDGPLITVADLPADLAVVEDDPSLVDDLAEAVKRFEKRHVERGLAQ